MKKTRIIAVLSLVCVFFLCLWAERVTDVPAFQSAESVLGVGVVSVSDVTADKEQVVMPMGGLCFEDVSVMYDEESETYYLPQNMDREEWEGTLSFRERDAYGDTFYLCMSDEEEYRRDKRGAIADNHVFTLYGVSKNSFCQVKLVVTGTPLISLEIEDTEEIDVTLEEDPDEFLYGADEEYSGSFCLFDPGNDTRNYSLVQSKVKFHRKGVSTRYSKKPSYSIKLRDVLGEDAKVSLLGLRESHSWKLNSLYTDENRIREKTASQVWEGIAKTNVNVDANGPRMEYVEVFVDNKYMGLYCLVEAVDEEQLSLTEGEYLYKAVNWDVPELEQIQDSIEDKWNVCSSVRIRYPRDVQDYEAAWEPIREYLETFYHSSGFDYDDASTIVDMDNLADMMFFIMTIGGADNTYKNMYFSWQQSEKGNYTMVQIPWDLDLTFGNLYDEEERGAVFNSHTEWVFSEAALPRFKMSDTERMGDEVYARWLAQRKGSLSTEAIEELLLLNRDYLVESGAIVRESAKWQLPSDCMDIEYLLEFQRQRMEWLDTYFAEWTGQRAE